MMAPAIKAQGDSVDQVFADSRETESDVRFLEGLRESRKNFFNELVRRSADQDEHFLAGLRQEPAYQISEFFYLLKAFGVDSETKIRNFATLHNQHMEGLFEGRAKMRRLDLNPDRVRKAMLSDDNLAKVVENYKRGGASFDQSDLSRLVLLLMSQETFRKIVVALARAGFIEREKTHYQSILVRSTGVLEDTYARHLRALHHAVTAPIHPTGET
jgi:hypothetical protein